MAGTDASDGLIAGLIAEYGRALHGYFRRATGGGDVAEDLVQEVFVRVAGASYEPRGRERAWLFTIAHNVLVQHLRRHPRQTVALHERHEPVGPAHQDLRAALDQALQQLPDLDRHVFLLSELGGLTYAEIAASCSLSHASVRSRIFRARLALGSVYCRRPRRRSAASGVRQMTTDDRDVLSAVLDNEPVDADELARLLEAPANRQLLVDFVRLRTALRDADSPGTTPAPQHVPRPPMTRMFLRSVAGLALVGLGLTGGAWYARQVDDAPAAPTPSRIVQLTPLDSGR